VIPGPGLNAVEKINYVAPAGVMQPRAIAVGFSVEVSRRGGAGLSPSVLLAAFISRDDR
jgi:hypothetical protein